MEWKNLSEEAKSIIEWVVNPFTDARETIEIKIGEVFHRKCPKLCMDFYEPVANVNIPVTKKLYQEIFKYVDKQADMQYEKSSDGLIFRLKDGVEI